MSIVNIEEDFQPLKYLVVTQQKDPESLITTNLVISDTRVNKINLISIERGPVGSTGPQGPQGAPGKDGIIFNVLPINSGGTNNTIFSSGSIIFYDGNKLSSSNYTIDDILNSPSRNNSLTGIIADSGLYLNTTQNTATLGINFGDGLTINNNNQIIVDDTIVRKVELDIGNIDGVVPIAKGGTNNQNFISNRLLYFDGFKISSFPLATGRILLSGTTIDIIAGSGLTGGGSVSLPSGSVVLSIGGSSDIIVENKSISLSATGTPGTYSKVTTDSKGRVISGSSLTANDIVNILQYTPWHSANDGSGSGLDADLLDGLDSSYFLDIANQTGTLNPDRLPIQSTPGLYTKVQVNDKGIVLNGLNSNYGDIVSALGYRPVSVTGDTINGDITINGDVTLNSDNLSIKDNIPLIGTNSPYILPSEPRGFSFMYGGYAPRTGLLAYYPAERELRLITNIGYTGILDGGSGNNFTDIIDGGNANSVYIVGNLTGDMNVVLLRSVADSLYVNVSGNQNILGIKTFAQPINVNRQINIIPSINQSEPPINVGSNINMVPNLNVDLLHGKDLNYYNNAINMTGLFDYEKVEFNNIEGSVGFIPKFDDRTDNPSRTISNSNIQQTGNLIRILNNNSLAVGSTNSGSYDAVNSLVVGSNNKITGVNSFIVGSKNIVNANNSVALNSNSQALTNNSIAAGNYGYTWANNQVSFGSFREFNDSGVSIAQGQHSTITLGISGVQTDGDWVSMSPSILLPKNKTIAYTLQILMNKAAGTGAALFTFESGIIKNSTYRNPDNPSFTTNITSLLKEPAKTEIYNDSQHRRHYYHFNLDTNNFIQNLEVTAPNVRTLPLQTQNVESIYKYIPEYITCTGLYTKTNDGLVVLDIPKPKTYGWMFQDSGNPNMRIKSYFHNMVTGSIVDLAFISGSVHTPISRKYSVSSILDSNNFYVRETSWTGKLTNNEIILDPEYVFDIDTKNSISIDSGYLYTNSPDIYNLPTDISSILHTGMIVSFRPASSNFSYVPTQTGRIVSVASNSITLNVPFTGVTNTNTSINTQAVLNFNQYTKHVFDSSQTIHINIPGYGQQSVTNLSGAYPINYCNKSTYAIKISGLPNYSFEDITASVSPASINSGLVSLISHRQTSGTYNRENIIYKKYEGVYIRQNSLDGISKISIYNKYLEPIDLPSCPFSYSLVSGYGDDDNEKFEIYQSGLFSYLKFKNSGLYIYRTGEQPSHFCLSGSISSGGLGYIFYPLYSGSVCLLPSGIDPDVTYYPINISNTSGEIYCFDLSLSQTGTAIQAVFGTGYEQYLVYPRILDPSIQNQYSVRVKTTDQSSRSYDKFFKISIDDLEVRNNTRNTIPTQYLTTGELFLYTIPLNIFPAETQISNISLRDGTTLPLWLTFISGSNTLSGVPGPQNTGTLHLLAKATGVNLSVVDNFDLKISDGLSNTSQYTVDPLQSLDIDNITLSNVSVPKNISYDTIVGLLSTDGGYNPYIIFETSSNSFFGTTHSGSKYLTEVSGTQQYFPSINISGNIEALTSGNALSIQFNNNTIQNNVIVHKIISPISFSATIESGSNILNTSIDISNHIVSGNLILSNNSEWNTKSYRAAQVYPSSILLDQVFLPVNISSTGLTVFTSGYNILSDTIFTTGNNVIGTHTTAYNGSGSYYINNLKLFSTTYSSDTRCPTTLYKNNVKGFDTETSEYIDATGYYSTGLVSFYTNAGLSKITVSPEIPLYIDNNEDSIYLKFLSTNNSVLPKSQSYPIISGSNNSYFYIDNGYFFPYDPGSCTGQVLIDLEKNHGFEILGNNVINQIPVQFISAENTNSNRLPKNNLFDINNIIGNKIFIEDKVNYLLKENNKPDYFEQPINASYSTNGFAFLAVFVNNLDKLYNLHYNNLAIWPIDKILEPNTLIGSTAYGFAHGSRITEFTNGFYFDGIIPRNGNHIAYNGTFPVPVDSGYVMSVFSSGAFWPQTGVTFDYNGVNNQPLSVIYSDSVAQAFGDGTTGNPFTIYCTGNSSSSNASYAQIINVGYDYQNITINGGVGSLSGTSLVISKIDTTGGISVLSNNLTALDLNFTLWPKEIISINSSKNTDQPNFPVYALYVAGSGNINTMGNRINLSKNISSFGEAYQEARFFIKPRVKIDNKICLGSTPKTFDNRIFFNGNQITIDKLSTPRSYLNNNDQIKFLSFNNNTSFADSQISRNAKIVATSNNNTSISAIAINGPKILYPNNSYSNNDIFQRNTLRYANNFGLSYDQELPSSGTVSFIGSVSGYCNIPYFNNLYYHSYGGFTANWTMDPYGKFVASPQTGIYTISYNPLSCASGTMCVNIKGFNNTNFNNIIDIVDRSSIGKNKQTISHNNAYGYVRPWGTSSKFYLDFSDGAPELNGSYYINDKIDSTTITVTLPYNTEQINKSGLVYIIDSDFNIKTNVNPNIDNSFIVSNASINLKNTNPNILTSYNNLVDFTINSYNINSKRWKHLVHFTNNSTAYSGYNIKINNQVNSQLLYLNPSAISIYSIDYSLDYGNSYISVNNNNINITTKDDGPLYLRIKTINGSERWQESTLLTAPRINLNGINSYTIDTNTIFYDYSSKIWTVSVIIDNLKNINNDRNINIIASDETGSTSQSLTIKVQKIPEISIPKETYTYVNSSLPWSVNYDIKYLPDPYLITMSGYPGPSYTISSESFSNSSGTKIIYGYPGSNTGIYNTVLYVQDYYTQQVLSSQTGIITVLPLSTPKPSYVLDPIGIPDDIYLNIDNENNSASFYFYIDVISAIEADLVVSLSFDSGYTKTIIPEYSAVSNRFKVTINIQGSPGFYSNKTISIDISQPSINANDQTVWLRYNYSKNINITLYKNLLINTGTFPSPLSFDKQNQWFLQFYVQGGIVSHMSDSPPIVRLSNLPSKGTYDTQPLEYNIDYIYDDIGHRWEVKAIGKSDIFGNYTDKLGTKNIKIFAEDGLGYASGSMNISFNQTRFLTNLQNNIYSIPNQAYQTTFDIKQVSQNDIPLVTTPSQLKENTINLNVYYKKFDKNLNLYELSYSGSPIYNKWDSYIYYNNINTPLNDNQLSSLSVQCKGIASDKIYAIGKLELMELDSLTLGNLPIKITGIPDPYYSAKEGEKWTIDFKTLYGLENPNFPPTILLSGLPTICSGYFPSLPLQQQNPCLSSRSWNPSDKSWNFSFTGLPICGIEGIKSFSITAIDTDTVQNLALGSDRVETAINYTSLLYNGSDHPSPQILGISGAPEVVPLSPRCNSPIFYQYIFGPRLRETCPVPTGITGWVVSNLNGQNLLPSGLNYTITFPGGLPKRPWSNLGSGVLTIQGNPVSFAGGGEYPEKLVLTVYDGRGKFAQKIIRFNDTSSANPPSPIDLPVYFDNEKPAYTSRKNNESNTPMGTAPIDYNGYPTIPAVYWPAANADNLSCYSILPQNQCLITTFAYSGGNYQNFDFKVWINPDRPILTTNSIAYIEFDNNSNIFNGRYQILSEQNPPKYYVNVTGHNLNIGSGKLVQERLAPFNTMDLQKFIGNIDLSTTQGIMGCGTFANKQSYGINSPGYGLFGRLYPSIKATIPSGVIFSANLGYNIPPMNGLTLSLINNLYTENNSQIYSIKTSDCWQTGYLRVSGILLPAPTVELTDPAPAAEAPFAYNGQQYYVGSRCVYGTTSEDRNLPGNKRDVSINYRIKNLLTNTVYANSSVGSSQAIGFNHSENQGTVFSLFLNNNPSLFPTYISNAIRYAENEYFWIHKAGSKNETITQSSFPPIIIGSLNTISCLSGTAISGYNGVAVGGYVPFNGYSIPVPYYQLTDNTNWSTLNYPPIITGVVQSKILPTILNTTYSHSGYSSQSYQYISVNLTSGNPYNISAGDTVSLTFANNAIPPITILVDNTGIVNNSLLIPYNRSNQPPIINSPVKVSFLPTISEISNNNITINYKNAIYSTGDSVDIVSSSGSTLYNILPNYSSIQITSGNNNSIILSYNGSNSSFASGLASGNIVDIYKNYHDQINIDNITFSKEGYWSFGLSGTPTVLYKDYYYKIITMENSNMPIFSGTDLYPKKYSTVYNLLVNKPIKILLDNNTSIINNNGNWSLTFNVEGGLRPIQYNTPEIMVNGSICNFSRVLNPQTMSDQYDSNTDRLSITIGNNSNYDWRYDTSFELKVFDDTGYDIKTIEFNQ